MRLIDRRRQRFANLIDALGVWQAVMRSASVDDLADPAISGGANFVLVRCIQVVCH
jgi:hypothetical protein